ncbi:hypothetical protein DK846_05200 [Methanospirillum lacunae]|uniref:Uncharacterized protein n=1 Tax=Methanospirillum lacunae TaxID=668570 RepID=A0A2V2MYL4_9EURY|nr:hypothetical protein DK846_05200 [Methanospirillum lacunae]
MVPLLVQLRVKVQPAHAITGMLFQQAVPLETSPISREKCVILGVMREHSVRMEDLPVGHLEGVPLEVQLLGCVWMAILRPPAFVIRDQVRVFALMEMIRFPTGIHNLS